MEKIDSQAEEIKNLFRSIERNFRGYMAQQIRDRGFTVPQVMVMQELYNYPDITLKELSGRVGLSKSTVCGIVDRLEQQGAVARIRAKEDRRTVKISLTPKILELRSSLNLVKRNYLSGLLQNLKEGEVEKIVEGLIILNSLMESQGHE